MNHVDRLPRVNAEMFRQPDRRSTDTPDLIGRGLTAAAVALLLAVGSATVACDSSDTNTSGAKGGSGSSGGSTGIDSPPLEIAVDPPSAVMATDAGSQTTGTTFNQGPVALQLPDGFSEPTSKEMELPTGHGKIDATRWESTGPESGQNISVFIGTYPRELLDKHEHKSLLEAHRSRVFEQPKSDVLKKEPIEKRDGLWASSSMIERKRDIIEIYGRKTVYFAPPHLVAVIYVSNNKGDLTGGAADTLFSSVTIDPDASATESGARDDTSG